MGKPAQKLTKAITDSLALNGWVCWKNGAGAVSLAMAAWGFQMLTFWLGNGMISPCKDSEKSQETSSANIADATSKPEAMRGPCSAVRSARGHFGRCTRFVVNTQTVVNAAGRAFKQTSREHGFALQSAGHHQPRLRLSANHAATHSCSNGHMPPNERTHAVREGVWPIFTASLYRGKLIQTSETLASGLVLAAEQNIKPICGAASFAATFVPKNLESHLL